MAISSNAKLLLSDIDVILNPEKCFSITHNCFQFMFDEYVQSKECYFDSRFVNAFTKKRDKSNDKNKFELEYKKYFIEIINYITSNNSPIVNSFVVANIIRIMVRLNINLQNDYHPLWNKLFSNKNYVDIAFNRYYNYFSDLSNTAKQNINFIYIINNVNITTLLFVLDIMEHNNICKQTQNKCKIIARERLILNQFNDDAVYPDACLVNDFNLVKYNTSHNVNLLGLIKSIRNRYFPDRHHIGDCSSISIFIAIVLQYTYGITNIRLCHGKINNCYHMWLNIGQLIYDVSFDCTTINIVKEKNYVKDITRRYDYLQLDSTWFYYEDYYPDIKDIINEYAYHNYLPYSKISITKLGDVLYKFLYKKDIMENV